MIEETDPKKVLAVAMDELLPDQVVEYRFPTKYRIQYKDHRWRRVYAKRRGVSYIVIDNRELNVDFKTQCRLFEEKPQPNLRPVIPF